MYRICIHGQESYFVLATDNHLIWPLRTIHRWRRIVVFFVTQWGYLDLANLLRPSTQQISQRVAVPLMGAGCRAFPKDLALEVAALESVSWLSAFDLEHTEEAENRNDADEKEMAVVFGLLEREDTETLSEQLETLLR